MYHPSVSQKAVEKVEAATGRRLLRREIGDVLGWKERLEALQRPDGGLKRPLSDEERLFIASERVLSQLDYRYWAERYATIERDPEVGGGIAPILLWGPQEIALEAIMRAELAMHEALERGEPVEGIRIAWHKARQLGATMMMRTLLMHRATNGPGFRSISASVDEDKIFELYRRDKTILEGLPWFLKPSVGFDVKAEHLEFDRLKSFLLYQQSQQKTGLGQGRQFQGAHLTECAFWPYPAMIHGDFIPTLPRAASTLVGLESTANIRDDWWHGFTEDARNGGKPGWIYLFVPWYAEPAKYRRQPPEGWQPSQIALDHARKVHETSTEWVGHPVLLSKEQLYWWESEREAYRKDGKLRFFLANWCATPEESFQHAGCSAFPDEYLERVRLQTQIGIPYEICAAIT